jgi:hypothetical protein
MRKPGQQVARLPARVPVLLYSQASVRHDLRHWSVERLMCSRADKRSQHAAARPLPDLAA